MLPPITLDETLCHKMRGLNSINNSNVFDKNTTEYRLFARQVWVGTRCLSARCC